MNHSGPATPERGVSGPEPTRFKHKLLHSTAMIELLFFFFYDLRCCFGAGKAKINRGHLSGQESEGSDGAGGGCLDACRLQIKRRQAITETADWKRREVCFFQGFFFISCKTNARNINKYQQMDMIQRYRHKLVVKKRKENVTQSTKQRKEKALVHFELYFLPADSNFQISEMMFGLVEIFTVNLHISQSSANLKSFVR